MRDETLFGLAILVGKSTPPVDNVLTYGLTLASSAQVARRQARTGVVARFSKEEGWDSWYIAAVPISRALLNEARSYACVRCGLKALYLAATVAECPLARTKKTDSETIIRVRIQAMPFLLPSAQAAEQASIELAKRTFPPSKGWKRLVTGVWRVKQDN